MKTPTIRPDGSCPDCAHGWQCAFHQEDGVRRFAEREAMLLEVAVNVRRAEIDSVCARMELESDEFLTAEAKAVESLIEMPLDNYGLQVNAWARRYLADEAGKAGR